MKAQKGTLLGRLPPVVLILAFIIFLNSGPYMKKPFAQDEDFSASLEMVRSSSRAGDWVAAQSFYAGLDRAWRKVVKRVQFVEDQDDLLSIYDDLATLKGAIDAGDKPVALAALSRAELRWSQLGQ